MYTIHVKKCLMNIEKIDCAAFLLAQNRFQPLKYSSSPANSDLGSSDRSGGGEVFRVLRFSIFPRRTNLTIAKCDQLFWKGLHVGLSIPEQSKKDAKR